MQIIVTFLAFVTPFSIIAVSGAAPGDPRVIEFKTEKIGESVHWMPSEVNVAPGERVKFLVKHELVGGFDFHGLSIPVLKLSEQVNRNQPLESKVLTIPTTLKEGKYPIGCHFHPKHVAATLVVKK